MKLLLDTHLVIWALENNPKLSKRARLLIDDPGNDIYYSAASAWEIAIKHAIRPDSMLMSGDEFMSYCKGSGFRELPVSGGHVRALESLRRADGAPKHNDPFDRIMLSQAKREGMLFLTHDHLMADYEEECVVLV